MKLIINSFYPSNDIPFSKRQINEIVIEVLQSLGFKLTFKHENLIECAFQKDNVKYRFSRMDSWSFSLYGEIGLSIDAIYMKNA